MLIGMLLGVFVTVAEVTVSPPVPRAAVHARRPPLRRAPRPPRRPPPPLPALAPPGAGASEAYSLHARRRFAAYLRLRLLEMREAGLERAAKVIERRLPVDTLVRR